MSQFQLSQEKHLALVLIKCAFQIAVLVILSDRRRLVEVALPIVLEVECGFELLHHGVAVNLVAEE